MLFEIDSLTADTPITFHRPPHFIAHIKCACLKPQVKIYQIYRIFLLNLTGFVILAQSQQIVVTWHHNLIINTVAIKCLWHCLFPHRDGQHPTADTSGLFVFPIHRPSAIFEAASELFGAFYREAVTVFLSTQVRRWQRR